MSENRVKPVRHYSVRKREAREFLGSGLTSSHVNFARDVEVSTIATSKAWEEYNEESKIESQTLHYLDVFSVEFVVQFFWERFRTKFFWWSRRTRRGRAIRWQIRASRYRRGSRSRTNIPVIPNHKHWNPSDNTTNLTVSHVCRVGVRQLFLTIAFISCRYGLICCCYAHRFVAVHWTVVRKILDLKIINPIKISSPF